MYSLFSFPFLLMVFCGQPVSVKPIFVEPRIVPGEQTEVVTKNGAAAKNEIVTENVDDGVKKRFHGIELGPGILSVIQPHVRINNWTQAEIDAYYEVLRFAQRTPIASQKKQARVNFVREIQLFREELRAKFEQRIQTYQQLANQHSERADYYVRLETIATKRFEQQDRQLVNSLKQPKNFPLFARVAKSMIEEKPSRFHGQLVTLTGTVRKLVSYPAHKNSFGITRLYEVWMFTDDSQILRGRKKTAQKKTGGTGLEKHGAMAPSGAPFSKVPVVIIFTEKPVGMPEGDRLFETATVTGYLFRLHTYEDQQGVLSPAPMLLAAGITWHPRKTASPQHWSVSAYLFAGITAVLLVIVLMNYRHRLFWKNRRRQQLDLNESSLNDQDLDQN